MTKQFRWKIISETCSKLGSVSVDELVKTLGVSPATVRRDLQEMEDLRIISRFHGGARINTNQTEEPHMVIKSEINPKEKKALARRAAKLISDDQMIYLDAGSTTFEIIQYITAKNITVATPGIPHISALAEKDITTIVLGGPVRPGTQAIAGRQTVQQIESMFFDTAFIGVNGIHEKIGFTTSNESEASTKSAAIRRSTDAYILGDSTKFSRLSPFEFASLNEAVIITDSIPDQFTAAGARYILTDGRNNL